MTNIAYVAGLVIVTFTAMFTHVLFDVFAVRIRLSRWEAQWSLRRFLRQHTPEQLRLLAIAYMWQVWLAGDAPRAQRVLLARTRFTVMMLVTEHANEEAIALLAEGFNRYDGAQWFKKWSAFDFERNRPRLRLEEAP